MYMIQPIPIILRVCAKKKLYESFEPWTRDYISSPIYYFALNRIKYFLSFVPLYNIL